MGKYDFDKLKLLTLHKSDFALHSFAYEEICDNFDIAVHPETGDYPETIIFNIYTSLIDAKYD